MRLLFAAMAVGLTLSSVGCQSLRSPGCSECVAPCGPCNVACSRKAPRPTLFRDACPPQQCLLDGNGRGPCGPGCQPGCSCGYGYGLAGCGAGGIVNGAVGAVLDCKQCDNQYNFAQGPPTGQVAYPYYTVRGPRDFLQANPPSIGPY